MLTGATGKAYKLAARLELARRDFYEYCKLMVPGFYTKDKQYIKHLCNALQSFISDDNHLLCINIPPRHGKTLTSQLFASWLFGIYPSKKLIGVSYSQHISETFSGQIRNIIGTEKSDKDKIVYSDIFPNTKLAYGSSARSKWRLEGNTYDNYLSTSPNGTLTGFGANFMIIDDIVKDAYDAHNSRVLEEIWDWYTDTARSRLENEKKIILIMTRWAKDDLAGKLLNSYEQQQREDFTVIKYKVYDSDTDTMLCPSIFSKNDMEEMLHDTSKDIFEANYNQEPISLEGRLYKYFTTYDEDTMPEKASRIKCRIDFADKGNDYLVAIVYREYEKQAYVLDIFYDNRDSDTTQPLLLDFIYKNNVYELTVESNNMGSTYTSWLKRDLRLKYNYSCVIKEKATTKNKESKILATQAKVMNDIKFPTGWERKYQKPYEDMYTYQTDFKSNKHDDIEDVCAEIAMDLMKNNNKIRLGK